LLNFTLGRLWEFEQGGQSRHRHLEETGDILTTFAQHERNQEPKQLTAQELWNYIQLRQLQAVQSQNKKHFAEACLGGKTNTLYVCQNTETPTQLRYDPEHQIIGWWDDNNKIVGNTVIGWLHPVAPAFFGDEITVPCADKKGELNLVEFNPHGFFHFGNMPRNSISVIPAKNIWHRNVVKNINPHGPELFYCFVNDHWSPKVIHSGPGRTVISNKPIREFRIKNDVVFLAHESSGSCASYRLHSLQTGWYVEVDSRNIESQEQKDNDIIFTFRENQRLNWTLYLPWKEPIEWELGKKWWKKKSISLSELTEIWHEAARKAKEKETK
jgi:hypothetical protein